MPTPKRDRENAGLARATVKRLLDATGQAVASGVRVPTERERVFGPVYSWWRLVCRTTEAVLWLTEKGFTVEVAPMVRNVFNHTYAINWLVDNGDAAVEALVARGDDEREKLCKKMEETGWAAAAKYRSALDQTAAQQPAVTRTPAEEALHAKLKHELKNFYDMLDRYAVPDLYPVYSHLSGFSHATIDTASAYVEPMDDGSLRIRLAAAAHGYADILQVTLALVQSTTVVSSLIEGDPMRDAVKQAAADLGLEDGQLLPVRVK